MLTELPCKQIDCSSPSFKDATEDLKFIAGCISKLRNELQTNKPLIPLKDSGPDTEVWNLSLAELTQNGGGEPKWFVSPWLYVECYMYRRIQEAIVQWYGFSSLCICLSLCFEMSSIFVYYKYGTWGGVIYNLITLFLYVYKKKIKMLYIYVTSPCLNHMLPAQIWYCNSLKKKIFYYVVHDVVQFYTTWILLRSRKRRPLQILRKLLRYYYIT